MTRVMLAGLAALALWGTSHPLGLPDAQAATKEVVILTSSPRSCSRPTSRPSRSETEWDTAAKANYAKARELAESAAGRIK